VSSGVRSKKKKNCKRRVPGKEENENSYARRIEKVPGYITQLGIGKGSTGIANILGP